MAKFTRIYTRTGDDGTTGLFSGQRVGKNAPRIEAYGTLDELSSVLGLARAALDAPSGARSARGREVSDELDRWLAWTQDMLFNLGGELATLPGARVSTPVITAADAAALERAIDRAEADLEPLGSFIHPGGTLAGSFLHQARTVARRAERLLVTLGEREHVSEDARRFMNRLSDALFVWSRWINHALGRAEHRWDPNARPPE